MDIQTIKNNYNRGRMSIDAIKWLIDSFEQLQAENGAMAEKHAEKDIAITDFTKIVELQRKEIEIYKLHETILLERLKKQTLEIKELKQNSRLINFYKMAEENLNLAQKVVRYEEMQKAGSLS